jgi:hypothetical protein
MPKCYLDMSISCDDLGHKGGIVVSGRQVETVTWSTEDAARAAEVPYVTLRRWLAAGEFRPSVSLAIGSGAHKRRIWRFTSQDINKLMIYRAEERRGRPKGSGRPEPQEMKLERSRKSGLRQMLQRFGQSGKVTAAEMERSRLLRRYVKTLVELKNWGLYPKDHELSYVPRERISESKTRDAILHEVLDHDGRIMAEFLDPKSSSRNSIGAGRLGESVPMLFKREVMQRRMIGG